MDEQVEVGGILGGLARVYEAFGRLLVVLVVGRRLAKRVPEGAHIWVGALPLGPSVGLAIGAAADHPVVGAVLGLLFVAVTTPMVVWLVEAEEQRVTSEKAVRAGEAKDKQWDSELRAAGVSAHSIDAVRQLKSYLRDAYFRQYELNRQDKMPVKEAHDKAYASQRS